MSRRPKTAAPDRPARTHIVDVAARLFGEKGFHGTSVRDISNEVGILAGSLYAHIDSKQELLADICRRFSDDARSVLEPLEQASMSTRDKLRGVFAVYFTLVTDARAQARVVVHDFRSLDPPELEEGRRRRRDTQAIVERILRDGAERGEIRPVDPRLVATAVFSITNWSVEWFDAGRGADAEELATFFADLLIDGIGARPA